MKLRFDYYHNLEKVELRLCNPDGRELFPLPGRNRNLTLRFNDLSELTFEVDSKVALSDGSVVDLEVYDYIQTKRLVFATNIGWFQISNVDEHDNGTVKYKTVTTESYQAVLKNKGFISEERVYCFYNPNDPQDDHYDSSKEDSIPSVLGQWSKQLGIKQALWQGRAEPATPYDDWTVTYIHPALIYGGEGSICRTFKENTAFGYDWIINDVEKAFEVVVLFDFMYKTIHVMTPAEVAQSVNVIYTFNNFMKSVDINENAEDIVTVLNCNGNNCDITAVNPTGTNYICDFSYYMDRVNYRWMSLSLIKKLEQWNADCDAEKPTYEKHIKDIRGWYQRATGNETLLREMSLSLADLRTAQNKRAVLGSGTPGALCGIVTAESVIVGGNSIKPGTDYHSVVFTGDKHLTVYQYAPKYNEETRQWDWSGAGATMSGTADDIVAHNLSDGNTSGVSYWYFPDASDSSSYCKLRSATTVNKDSVTSEYYCGGFDRYIAYSYPLYVGSLPRRTESPAGDDSTLEVLDDDSTLDVLDDDLTLEALIDDIQNTAMPWSEIKKKYNIPDDAGGTAVYADKVSEWINLYETKVCELNKDLYGYAFALSGYQADYKKAVEVNDANEPVTYVTSGSGGKLLPKKGSVYYEINRLNALIGAIAKRLNILSYFANTPDLLRELNCYWIEGDYTNDNIAVLENTTPEEEIELSNELLSCGQIELSKVCQPHFSFSLDSRDATKQYEFKDQMSLLELGKIITIEKEEGLWYYPALLEISMNLDNGEEFTMTFANAMRLDDWGYTYADLISDASSTSRQVSANWHDILAYSKEREQIASIIKDPLDTTLRASFANMVNQEFTIDKNGILGRKKVSESSDGFEDEQVRLINNLLIFTDDNWETAKTALGKIYYTDDDGNQVTSYGLIAETIIGSLIMGNKLKILNKDNTIILDENGIVIRKPIMDDNGSITGYENSFEANAKTGALSVTGDIKGGTININDKFKVDEYGNVELAGNIVWGAEASPTSILYARNSNLTRPANGAQWSSFPDNDSGGWHKICGKYDFYASYTYDGGATWTSPIQVRGKNGENGDTIQIVYLYKVQSSPTPPGTPTHDATTEVFINNWSLTPNGVDEEKMYEFVSQCTVINGKYEDSDGDGNPDWSTPTMWAKYGETIQTVYLYKAQSSPVAPDAPIYDGDTNSIDGWSLTPNGVDEEKMYEFVSQCTVINGKYEDKNGDGIPDWSTPTMWSKYGSDANVTDYNVFNALTNNQTLFGCFYNPADPNNLYINANYINAGILTVADDDGVVFSADVESKIVKIGGWTVTKDELYLINGDYETRIVGAVNDAWRFQTRVKTGENTKKTLFGVRSDGTMHATKAIISGDSTFEGTITSSKATITGGLIELGDNKSDEYVKITQDGIQCGTKGMGNLTGSSFMLKNDALSLSYVNGSDFHVGTVSVGGISRGKEGDIIGGIRAVIDCTNLGNFPAQFNILAEEKSRIGYGVSIDFNVAKNAANTFAKLTGTWKTASTIIVDSDESVKNSIELYDDRYDILFDNMKPKRFKYNNGTSDRYHTGFMVQDVQKAIDVAKLSTKDFAAICLSQNADASGLRYEEFISLNTWQIQKLKARVAELEAIVTKLQEGQ